LDAIVRVAAGEPDAGPIAALSPSERFGWLTAPSSTIVQTSSVHCGLTDEPTRTLERLFERLVGGGASHRGGIGDDEFRRRTSRSGTPERSATTVARSAAPGRARLTVRSGSTTSS